MNVLISNDDGYLSKGIKTLADAAATVASVRVVAPDRDRSAVSNSLTLDRPLSIRQADNGYYYVNGTPTDCVHLALHAMDDFKPDMVFSGVNHGANMGDDTLYSGTVAAATEAYLIGIPAVAFSLNDRTDRYLDTAAHVVRLFAGFFSKHLPQQPLLWNINIPPVDVADLKGIKVTRLGRRHHMQSIVPATSPRGETVYWIGPPGAAADKEEGTDFLANEQGYVTVTPISIDLTDHHQLGYLSQSLCTLKL
ncbi:5'/3'-nucleotidase SurE [Neisseriaceae bacterium CLB008]|nr:5'/3'-nucleotidase SurE [Neisseriaceae bacterium]